MNIINSVLLIGEVKEMVITKQKTIILLETVEDVNGRKEQQNHVCCAFNKLAQLANEKLSAGDNVVIRGRISGVEIHIREFVHLPK